MVHLQTQIIVPFYKESYNANESTRSRKDCKYYCEYIDYETAAAIMHKLYDEVGQHTENESLAVSLEMLSQAYSQ